MFYSGTPELFRNCKIVLMSSPSSLPLCFSAAGAERRHHRSGGPQATSCSPWPSTRRARAPRRSRSCWTSPAPATQPRSLRGHHLAVAVTVECPWAKSLSPGRRNVPQERPPPRWLPIKGVEPHARACRAATAHHWHWQTPARRGAAAAPPHCPFEPATTFPDL